MKQKMLFFAIIASTFTTQTHAGSSPASVAYVQSQISSILNYFTTTVPTYTVGQQALGGTVFYVDSTGTHGLVAASNQNARGQYWNGQLAQDIIVNATGDGIGAGFMNTSLMVGVQSSYAASVSIYNSGIPSITLSDMAAQVCVNYSAKADGTTPCQTNVSGASCVGNWYLPSLYELNQMYLQPSIFNSRTDAFFWSSTESNQSEAWRINFDATSSQQSSTAKSDQCAVWCIHSF